MMRRHNPRNPQTETPASSAAFRRWFGRSVTTDRNGDPVVFYHGSDEPDIEEFSVQRTSYGYFFTPDVDTAAYYGDNVYEVYLKIENLADLDEPLVFDKIAREAVDYTEKRDREAVRKFAARLYHEGYGKHPAITAFFDAQRDFEYVLNEGWDVEEMLDYNYVEDTDVDALVARINQPNVTNAYNDAAPVESEELREAEEAYGGQDFYMNYQNDFLHAAENLGYDGVVLADPSPTGEAISYVVFSPKQIKSATKNAGTFDPDDANIYRNPRSRVRTRTRSRRNPDPTATPASSATKGAAFRRWFGKSKVVDAEGSPRVVYHGTAYAPGQPSITEFRGPHQPFRYPAFSGGRGKFVGVGSFFSESEEVAASYPYVSLPQTQNYTRVVHTLYLRIERPKVYRTLRAAMEDMVTRVGPDPVAFVALLRAEGYDGITFMEGPSYAPTSAKKKARVWVAFDPRQVKSATDNAGTFDPDDPSTLRNPRTRSRR